MKIVLQQSTVAHYWANKVQYEGRTSNGTLYFREDIIYSYGSHFPIAAHHNGIVLFTNDSYSMTTTSHVNLVRSAISHKEKIYCHNPEEAKKGLHYRNIGKWIDKILWIANKKLLNARKPEKYISEID